MGWEWIDVTCYGDPKQRLIAGRQVWRWVNFA